MINDSSKAAELVIDNLIKLVVPKIIESLALKFAFISWGPISWVLSFVLPIVLKFSLKNLAIAANSLFIRIDIAVDVAHMESALNEAYLNDGPKTPETIGATNEKIKQAMRNLISIGRARL